MHRGADFELAVETEMRGKCTRDHHIPSPSSGYKPRDSLLDESGFGRLSFDSAEIVSGES